MFISPLSVNALQRNASAFGSGGGGADNPIFSAFGGDSALANLDQALSINSTSQTNALRVEAKDAGASTWAPVTGATSLAIGGSGTAPTLGGNTPLTATVDKAVTFAAAKYYSTGSTSAYDIATATSDVVFECVFRHKVTGAEQALFGKYDTGTGLGYLLVSNASDQLQAYGAIAHVASATLVDNTWYHYIVFADRNGSNRAYLNGALIANTANLNNAQSNTQELKLGAYGSTAAGKSSQAIAYFAQWVMAGGTLNTTAEQDALAVERMHRLAGTYPIVAAGSAAPTFTRASVAYVDRPVDESTGERRLYKVGSGWPRVCRRKNGSDGWYNGLLAEGAVTNRLLRSDDFTNASWTKLNGSGAAGTTAPDESTNGYAFTPSVSVGTHALQQTVAGSTDYVSIFAKKGANDYMGIRLNSGGTDWAIFNLANGTVANTSGSSINATIIDYGNGWYLCGAGPGGGTNQIYFVTTNSSSSLSYTELSGASVGTYFFGAVSSNTTQRFSQSHIQTVAATASRQADSLSFVSATNYPTQPGAMQAEIMCPASASLALSQGIAHAYTDASNQHLVTLSTGGLPTAAVTTSGATQVSGAATTNCRDATVRRVTASFADNDYKLGVDNVSELTDASCTMPAATTLYVGCSQAGLVLAGLLTSFKVYPKTKL